MNKQLNSTSFSLMISALNKCLFLGLLIPYMFKISKTSTFISVIIGFVISLFFFVMLLLLFNVNSNLSFVGKVKNNFSKPFSFFVTHLQIVIVIMLASMLLWRLSSFATNEYLYETPIILVVLLISLPIFYISVNNFTVLCRFNTLCFMAGLVIIIFNFIGLLPHYDVNNFKPFFTDSFGSILNSAIHYAVLTVSPVFLLTIVPKNDISDCKSFNKKMMISFVYSNIMGFLIFFTIQMSLHIDLINLYTYPAFTALKIINLSNFIDSVENVSSILWYIYITLAVCMCVIYAKFSIKEFYSISNNRYEKILGIAIVIIILLIVLPIANMSYYLDKISIMKFPFYMLLILLLSYLFVLIISKLKNKS